MAEDFAFFAKAATLTTLCLYGGSAYAPQENILRRGVDVVIGTPGRVKDHLERGNLRMSGLRCATLLLLLLAVCLLAAGSASPRGLQLAACCDSAACP